MGALALPHLETAYTTRVRSLSSGSIVVTQRPTRTPTPEKQRAQVDMSRDPAPDPEKGLLNPSPTPKLAVKRPYPFWLGGVAASLAGGITHPLDLTKVRLQTSGDKGMLNSIRRTVGTAGVRGLFDGLTGTLLRQMTYSMMRFAFYDKAKAALHTGECAGLVDLKRGGGKRAAKGRGKVELILTAGQVRERPQRGN